jgi:2-polyprenyl-6-methoxyphenol hydroxylase-like FAD-dependent oxidoreductase
MTQVVIVGAGIGGLTLYHALRRQGITAAIYESTPVLQEVGAGILVPSNGMQVLGQLGLATAVREHGCQLERGDIYTASGGLLQTLEFAPYAREFGDGTVAIHRATLQEILARDVSPNDLHLGKRSTQVLTDASGATVSFDDGSTVQAPVIVGSDGINSVVRQSIFPSSQTRSWRPVGYRGVVTFELPPHLRHTGQSVWGDGCESGFADIGGGRVYWYMSIAPAKDDQNDVSSLLRQRLVDFPKIMRDMVAATDPTTILRTVLYDLAPLSKWFKDNVVLLGDAAHASTPYLGQGAAQAMEDAHTLATVLAHYPVKDALGRFQQSRVKKAHMVVQLSRTMGHLSHIRNPILRTVRNIALRSTPGFVTRRQMNQLFTVSG